MFALLNLQTFNTLLVTRVHANFLLLSPIQNLYGGFWGRGAIYKKGEKGYQ